MLDVQFDAFPEFRTARLLMREIIASDAEDLFLLRTDPQITLYLDRENEQDVDSVRPIIVSIRASFEAGEGITWGLCLPGEKQLIGTMSIWRIDKKHHRGEVGYSLLPAFWRKGLMAEAMEVAIAFAFGTIGLHSLEANTSVGNAASHALLKKFGFVQEAHFRENWYFQGQFYNSVIFSLLASNAGIDEV